MASKRGDVLVIRDKRIQEWHKLYPKTHFTPWDSCNPLEYDKNHRVFLNPGHQQHLNCGNFTDLELFDWLDGKPGAIIKSKEHWDELVFMCQANAYVIGYDLKHFQYIQETYLLDPGQVCERRSGKLERGVGITKKMLRMIKTQNDIDRMSPEFIAAIESHVKHLYTEDFISQYHFLPGNSEELYYIKPSREVESEVFGFMSAFTKLGMGHWGACNLPTERENFSWWKGILENEAKWELWIAKGIAYQPWADNKKMIIE